MAKAFYENVLDTVSEVPVRRVRSNMPPHDVIELPPWWYLGTLFDAAGEELFSDELNTCQRVSYREPVRIAMDYDGEPSDFSFTTLNVPVASKAVAGYLQAVAPSDLQVIPAVIDGHTGEYCVLNVVRSVRCVNEGRSVFTKWEAGGKRPDRVGEYQSMLKLVIDPRKAGKAMIFRPWGLRTRLVCAEEVKVILESPKIRGIGFEKVNA